MIALLTIMPDVVAEIAEALSSRGRSDLVSKLRSGNISYCTYDELADAGYIYFIRAESSPHFEKFGAPVAETIPFLESGFNVDIDHDGNIFGIEYLSRADFLSKLRQSDAL